MRTNKKRTLILSIASATAILPGCGDSADTSTTSTDASQENPRVYGSVAVPATDASLDASHVYGLIVQPAPDAAVDGATGVITTGVMVQPADAGDADAPRMIIGVIVEPADAGDAHSFPGIIIKPEDGSANG